MKKSDTEFALEWMDKAKNDFITAQQTLALPDGPTDTPSFHCQQAVEKSLKALLTFHHISFPKIHDLLQLLDMSSPLLPCLDKYREKFAAIAGYAVEVRYPGNGFNPSREDAKEALRVAEEVISMVTSNITSSQNKSA